MAIVWQSRTSGSGTSNKPTGTASGDLLIASRFETTYGSGFGSDAAPSGWTKFTSVQTDLGNVGYYGEQCTESFALYYKVAGGSEPTTYTWAGGGSITIDRYTGAHATTPLNVYSAVARLTATSPSVTTTVADTLVCVEGIKGTWQGDGTAPTGMTKRTNIAPGMADVAQVASGASGTKVWGNWVTSWQDPNYVSWSSHTATFAIAPAGGGASGPTNMASMNTVTKANIASVSGVAIANIDAIDSVT